jgi:rhodanese-related sulfurtransferase
MRRRVLMFAFTLVLGLALARMVTLAATDVANAQGGTIYQATLAEPNQKTSEVSTEELRRILADGSAIVLDSRSHAQFVAGHIPGARNLDAPRSGTIAAVERLVSGDKSKPLVLYCNGPFCQASREVSEQLVGAGFTNVRRYQLGLPVWRALGGVTEIELDGIVRIFNVDRTAVFVDGRTTEEFSAGSLPGARNIPVGTAKFERHPLLRGEDFNTRIVVFGRDSGQARSVAEAIVRAARNNVSYFPGTFDTLRKAIK